MSKVCQYTFVAGPRKGEKCNKLLRKPTGICYRHKSQKDKQVEYKELIQDMREKKNKSKFPQPVPEKKRLSNIVNKAIEEVITKRPEEEEEEEVVVVAEEVSSESSIELELDNIKPSPKPVMKKPITPSPIVQQSAYSSDDELIDQCTHAVLNNLPTARSLITQMLKRELITDEEYDKLIEQLKK